jgi:subtilisin family serine protease
MSRSRNCNRKEKSASQDNVYEALEPKNLLAGIAVDFSVLEPTDYTHTEILVRFEDNFDIAEHFNARSLRSGTQVIGELGEGFRSDSQLFEIPVNSAQSIPEIVNYYNSLEFVDYAEPNYLMETAAVPNDQFYDLQWGFPNIDAPSAWDTRTDASSVIVGVIDSGVQYDHPDLQANIWTNSGEIEGNGIDDDGNGYIDDFYGYDFDNDDSDPMDDNGHGTHVAGTIGAVSNNSIGVSGVAWNASLMSLKVIGGGSNADVARAIDYATENGAQITNNSYGYAGNNVGGSQVMSDAIGRADDAGVLYIAAAGNSRTGIPASDIDGSFNSWPAEYSKVHDNVITVSAIDEDGSFASYSHWGDESVQIAAPGTRVASTYTDSGYVYLSGTSMAAPHVAGAAALLWAERPDLSHLEIKDAILNNTRPEHLDRVTNGVLDLGQAMADIANGSETEIGFSGIALDVTHNWQTVNLPVSFDNPVVVAGGSTRDGGHQGVVRVQNVDSDSFQIRFQEWDYRDGNHTTENISYLVVEAGTHILTDGTQLVAGTTTLTNEIVKTITFGDSFSSAPLIIAQTMTNNDPSAVVERIRNIGTDTFQMRFNEEEVADGIHATETVGYIAIDVGAAESGDISLNAVKTGNSVTHQNTTVNFGSIDGSSSPVILSDMQTLDGGDAATLRHRSQTSTSVTLFVEEEASRDSELAHTTEVAGVLALEQGVLFAGSPQLAASIGPGDAEKLTRQDLDPIIDDAASYWADRGFDISSFDQVNFVVSDLKNQTLGLQYRNTIYIDVDAAGHGWYVDENVSTTERFEGMDLYSTVTHELGHILGFDDIYHGESSENVMNGYLSEGDRQIGNLKPGFDTYFAELDDDELDFVWIR